MGLFSSLKNMVTGGGATVAVEVPAVQLGKPFKIMVHLEIKEADVKANNVYARIQCEVKNKDFIIGLQDTNNDGQGDKMGVTTEENTKLVFNEEIKLAEEGSYNGGQKYSLSKEFTLPQNAKASSEGLVTWKIYAGMDTRGNDPDSGWQVFEVTE